MELKESFIGFTFGGKHSSQLGIVRVVSDKYEAKLSPVTSDKTLSVNGADGEQYFGSTYSKQEMVVPFAFYGLTDEQLRRLKQAYNDKKIHNLILDEEPHKVWSAKLTGISTAKHLCFIQNGTRVYHGEGNFVFTMYYPFARSRYPYIEDYTEYSVQEWNENLYSEENNPIFLDSIYPTIFNDEENENDSSALVVGEEDILKEWLQGFGIEETDANKDMEHTTDYYALFYNNELNVFNNINEWISASGLPSEKEYGDWKKSENGYECKLYNAGDVEMPFQLYLKAGAQAEEIVIGCGDKKMVIRNLELKRGEDYFLLIDTRNRILRGCDMNYKVTKNIYNHTIVEGDFFSLPVGEATLKSTLKGRLDFNYLYI